MDMQQLLGIKDRNALVIGAGQGIGAAVALRLAEAGCRLVCVDLEAERAQAIVKEIEAIGGSAKAIVGNVVDDGQVDAIMAQAQAAFDGGLDILVTVVGSSSFQPLLETSLDQWDIEQKLNLRYVFTVGKAFAGACRDRGKGGAMTFVASVSGMMAAPRHAPYGAAKAGLIHLVKTMAVEWAPLGIRVNAVAPGSIITPRLPDTAEWREQIERSAHPMQRRGRAEEIADPALFLSSDMASYVTGQTLAVDGGLTIANLMAVPPKLKTARAE